MLSRCNLCRGNKITAQMGGIEKTCHVCNGEGWVDLNKLIDAKNKEDEMVVQANRSKGKTNQHQKVSPVAQKRKRRTKAELAAAFVN